jgi:hypothetical protein
MVRHGGEVIVNEMPDAMMRDVAEFRPIAQRADGGFLVFRENPAEAKADDVRELVPTRLKIDRTFTIFRLIMAFIPRTFTSDCPAARHRLPSGSIMIKEHDSVVLTQDLAVEGLKAGDIGTVVHIHDAGAGYEVEFMTLVGETVTVVTLLPSRVRGIAPRDIVHVREFQAA